MDTPDDEVDPSREAALPPEGAPSLDAVPVVPALSLEIVPEPEADVPLESAPEVEVEAAPQGPSFWTRITPFVSWFSLAGGIVGAVLMDRRESQAPWIAAGTAASWVGLVVASLLHRKRADVQPRQTGAFKRALRFTTFAANQSLVQLSLFFCAPFYVHAFVWTPLEALFGALFVLAIVASLWDPLCLYVLLHPALGPLLLAFSSFVAWNAVLPMLGVPHRVSVWAAAGAVSLAIPLVQVVRGGTRRELLGSLGVSALLPLVLAIGGARALPPAPLNLVEAAIGTRVVDRTLVDPTTRFKRSPGSLVCFTAIQAPTGLKEKLAHVWRRDGEITQRIPLDVRGGRKAGFRTWSRLPLPGRAHGTFRCDVVTTLGQTLGGAEATIGD